MVIGSLLLPAHTVRTQWEATVELHPPRCLLHPASHCSPTCLMMHKLTQKHHAPKLRGHMAPQSFEQSVI